MNSIEYFDKNGYVVLKDALNKEDCIKLTEHMFNLKREGKTEKDEQCPLSDAVYGDPIFDKILQDFAEPIGKTVGKTLLPTYTYARIYSPGEVLKKHKDRPACEISATLTLGYNGKSIWPIFFDEEKATPVVLEVGEMAVYKGCDVEHWRTEFKGNWHVQVFFHYVDANGPHKDEYKDRRSDFGVQKPSDNKIQPIQNPQSIEHQFRNPIFGGVIIPSTVSICPGYTCLDNSHYPRLKFTKEECNKIINLAKSFYPAPASVGSDSSAKLNTGVRSADTYVLENDDENRWVFDKISKAVSVANGLHFGYDIAGITHGIQLIHYKSDGDVKGHYDWHIDMGHGEASTRKISFTAQLSEENSYEGCNLELNNNGTQVVGTREQGSIHMFPSYMLHRVTPITKGERYALVIWVHGSNTFR